MESTRSADTGRVESLDGWWLVTWEHAGARGELVYDVELREDGSTYVARRDEGRWLLAPSYLDTVDMRTVLDESDDELHPLLDALNRAAGIGTPGVLTFTKETT